MFTDRWSTPTPKGEAEQFADEWRDRIERQLSSVRHSVWSAYLERVELAESGQPRTNEANGCLIRVVWGRESIDRSRLWPIVSVVVPDVGNIMILHPGNSRASEFDRKSLTQYALFREELGALLKEIQTRD